MKPNTWWLKRKGWLHQFARLLMIFAALGYALLPSSIGWANPTGEQVVGGAATFHREGNTLTVNQTTDRLAVNWQDFSIGAGERTHFNMPSATSAALNRVLGGNPSQIYGSLSANGILYLVNPAGIMVGPGGIINTAAFVGSTLDMNPEQFMHAGQGQGMNLYGDSYAPIVNQGSVRAEEGDVFLIAQKVENRGTISAPNGRAALVGAGRAAERTEVVLHEVGGAGFAVRVTQLEGEAAQGMNGDLPDGEELLNEGEIAAAQAELNASGNIYALAIKNTGTIRAKAVVAQTDGTVRLDGGLGDVRNTGTLIAKNDGEEATAAGGKIEVTGRNVTASPESVITAAGGEQGGDGGKVKIDSADTTIVQGKVNVAAPSAAAKGGKVELLGEKVGLFDGAKVDASGGAGGGTVLVGGDYLGGQRIDESLRDRVQHEAEPVKNAQAVVVAETAEVKADATANGDGGKIILWSDEYTGFYGQLFARGGAGGGDGGFVETSSKINLQAFGGVLASAPFGRAGLWLLDPTDVVISTATANGAFSGGNPNVFTPAGAPAGVAATANVATINASLAANSDVRILTSSSDGQTGTITVGAVIASGAGTGDLALVADGGIFVNTPINLAGDVSFSSATGVIAVNANITTTAGNVTMTTSGGDITVGADVEATLGQISLNSSAAIEVGGTVTAAARILFSSGAAITIDSGGTVQNTGGAGNIAILSGAGIELDGVISTVGTTGAGGNILLDANGGNIGGTGVVILENPDTATGSSLGIQASGSVDVFVSMPVLDELTTTIPWDVQAAGPVMAIDAGGSVQIRNRLTVVGAFGDVGSALVAGTVNGIIGWNSGGDMEMNAGAGNIILGGATVISGGDFVARAAEPTAGIIFKAPSDRITPAVSSSGRQTYYNLVTLNAYAGKPAGAPGDSPALTVLQAGGEEMQFRQSINDGSVDGANIVASGRESLLLIETAGGSTQFLDYVGTHRNSTDGLGTIDYLGPLYSFRHEEGELVFYAVGTAVAPTLGTTLGPSIYVLDAPAGTTRLAGAGTATFDNTDIRLFENTYITTYGDVLFGGTINGVYKDIAPTLTVETLLYADAVPTDPAGGQIIFDRAIGDDVGLGYLHAVARGWRPDVDPYAPAKDSQITINNINTFAGTNPVKELANGEVFLTADGSVIMVGVIDTRGPTPGPISETIRGTISITSDDDGDNPLENIQLGTSTRGATLRTQGGDILFNKTVFFGSGSIIDNTFGNPLGTVTFAQNIFLDEGAAFRLISGGEVQFLGDINGDRTASVFIRVGNGNNLILDGTIGAETPLGSFTVGDGTGVVRISNNIQTAGGAVSFGMVVEMLEDISIDTTKGANITGGNIEFRQSVRGSGPLPSDLKNLTLNAGSTGTILFSPAVGDTGDQPNSAEVNTLWIKDAAAFDFTGTVTAQGKNDAVFAPLGWEGASIVLQPTLSAANSGSLLTLQATGGGSGDVLFLNGIFTSFLREKAGSVTVISQKGKVDIRGAVSMEGGADLLGNFGFDGGTLKTYSFDSFIVPDFIATGGRGTLSDGRAGNLIVKAGVEDAIYGIDGNSAAQISFPSSRFEFFEDSFIKLSAGRDVVLGTLDVGTGALAGGTVVTLNSTSQGTVSSLRSRGGILFEYGAASDEGSFVAPTSGGILSNGGDIVINRIQSTGGTGGIRGSMIVDENDPDYQSPAAVLYTTAPALGSGRVYVNTDYRNNLANVDSLDATVGDVFLAGIFTLGGAPGAGTAAGVSGGDVVIQGRDIEIYRILTRGSDSANGAGVTIGGSGGNITIRGSSDVGRGIVLLRNLDAQGGNGLSTLAGFGGTGGTIRLEGNVTLNTGDASLPSLVIDTQGGTGSALGEIGFGGNIRWNADVGLAAATLSGSPATSTLDLRYGNGTVSLGKAGDTVDLDSLITAADDVRSTGTLRIGADLVVDSLTTYARGYSIEILGGGTVATFTDFLNTGYVQFGDGAGDTTEFTSGLNTQNGPSATVLGGNVLTSREVSDAGLLFGNVELAANTFLNTFGNTLQVGTLNSITSSHDLELDAEIGNATVSFTGAVGASAGSPSVLEGKTLAVPGTLTFRAPVDGNGDPVTRVSPITFGQAVSTVAVVQESGASLEFDNDVSLTGTGGVVSTFDGDITLANLAYTDNPTAVLTFSSGDSTTFNGAVLLQDGPIELEGTGDFILGATGTLDGAQDLFLSGTGTKDFSLGILGGTTPIGFGVGPAITMEQGDVIFGDLETASGLDSLDADVTFTGTVVLGDGDSPTLLDGVTTTLSGVTITSADDFVVGGNITVSGDSTLQGAGDYDLGGGVSGPGFRLSLAGAGGKSFGGTVSLLGVDQEVSSGGVIFADDVGLTGDSTFGGSLQLAGPLTFTSGGVTSLTTLSLSAGTAILTGAGSYNLSGGITGNADGTARNLTFSATTGHFQGPVSGVATLAVSAGTATFSSTLGATALHQTGGTVNLNGNVTLAGASTLATANLGGISFVNSGATTINATVTTTGTTSMSSSAFTLAAATPLVSSGTLLTLTGPVVLGVDATLGGAGAMTLNGAVSGNQLLNLANGTKTFASTLNVNRITQAAGNAVFLADVTTAAAGNSSFGGSVTLDSMSFNSGGTITLQTLSVTATSSILTTSDDLTVNGTVSLLGGLILNDGGGGATTTLNTVIGNSSLLSVTTDDIDLLGAVSTGSGAVTFVKADGAAISVGLGGTFLTEADVAKITTSGGLTVATNGDLTLNDLTAVDTGGVTGVFRFDSSAGSDIILSPGSSVEVSLFGGEADEIQNIGLLTTRGFQDLILYVGDLNYLAPGSLALADITLALGDLDVQGAGLTLSGEIASGGRADFAAAGGNISLAGNVVAPTAVTVNSGGGYFINRTGRNPFASADTRILTRNLFADFPSNGAVPGFGNIFGATTLGQVGPNQIGVTEGLLVGSAGPYITEFTTGTGQPYILATQNAVPAVVSPVPISTAGAFSARFTYSEEELGFLTPEERSTYESQIRRQSARVILERSSESEPRGAKEISSEGTLPQAHAPASAPLAPTAKVYLHGKPLASKEPRNSTQILRQRPSRAVAQATPFTWERVLLDERMAAETHVGSIPVANATE